MAKLTNITKDTRQEILNSILKDAKFKTVPIKATEKQLNEIRLSVVRCQSNN